MTGDDWSHPEIVRNLKALTAAVHELVGTVGALGDRFLPRTEAALRAAHVDDRLAELGVRVLDVEADMERHRREHASTWSSWVVPIVTGALVAVVSVLVAVAIGR